jgi:hypothetical protein
MGENAIRVLTRSVPLVASLAVMAAIIAVVYVMASRRVAGFPISFRSAIRATATAAVLTAMLVIVPALLLPRVALRMALVALVAALPLQLICTARLIVGPNQRPIGYVTAFKLFGVCLIIYVAVGIIVDIIMPRLFG